MNEYGDWFPCAEELGPLPTREEYREQQRAKHEAAAASEGDE